MKNELRKKVIEKAYELNLSHIGSTFSCIDFVESLYENTLRQNKDDLFIMSKGHGAPALYVILEKYGKKPEWTMHPEYNPEQGIYATTGSLGHGLPIAIGRAFAKTQKKNKGIVHVLLGDCELGEGSVWESLIIANNLKIDNLNIYIDFNKYGATDSVKEALNLDKDSILKKLDAFDCHTHFVNGHYPSELRKIKYIRGGLNAVVLDTVKGKGIKSLEQSHAHGLKITSEEQYNNLISELS